MMQTDTEQQIYQTATTLRELRGNRKGELMAKCLMYDFAGKVFQRLRHWGESDLANFYETARFR
jgi:hypothetical protein